MGEAAEVFFRLLQSLQQNRKQSHELRVRIGEEVLDGKVGHVGINIKKSSRRVGI